MEMRLFGRTGMRLSIVGCGCGSVGGLMVRGDPGDQERTMLKRQCTRCTRCTSCGSKCATLQRLGWAGSQIGFYPFPTASEQQ
jgi:hypothetical protein